MTSLDLARRQQVLSNAYRHYVGTPDEPLIHISGQPNDNLIISLGRLIVDKGVSFLFGQSVQSQITLPQPEPKQDWLDECWRRNKRALTLQKLAMNGGIFGHTFARIVARSPYPRVIVLDPQTVQVMTDPDDIDTVWKFTITPPKDTPIDDDDAEPLQRRTIIANENGLAGQQMNRPERWTIIDQVMQGGSWVQVAAQVWPFPFCPIVHCQNLPRANDFWGESDIPDDILKILDGINRVASHYNKIIRIHAHPKVFTTGMGTRVIDTAIDAVISLPSENAKMEVLEMQSDLSSTMALVEKLLELLAMMTRIPLVALGQPDNLGAISGVALQIRYQPLLEKTESKRNTYGDLLVELDRCLLAMRGFGDAIITNLVWPNILPSDQLEERQVWVLDESLGLVSKETLSDQAGYDFEQEQKRIVEERQAAIAAGLEPDPTLVPPPAAIKAPNPDIAKTAKSK